MLFAQGVHYLFEPNLPAEAIQVHVLPRAQGFVIHITMTDDPLRRHLGTRWQGMS